MPGEGEPVQSKCLDHNRRPPAWENVAIFIMPVVLGLRGAFPKHLACPGQAWGSLEAAEFPKQMGICRQFG